MSLMYCTVEDLASFLQKDLDTATATLDIQIASQLFSARADTWFQPTTVTYQVEAFGQAQLRLPFRPVTAVSAVRVINAANVTTTVTDYTRIKSVLYRLAGFGFPGSFPPDRVEVDLTHGYASVPDDVKGAVLETAGAAYQGPDVTVAAESIDDYQIKMAAKTGGVMLTESAAKLADLYRGSLVA